MFCTELTFDSSVNVEPPNNHSEPRDFKLLLQKTHLLTCRSDWFCLTEVLNQLLVLCTMTIKLS